MNRKIGGVMSCLLALSVGSNLSGQTATMTAIDEKFVRDAAFDGMAEVKLGQLAQQKSSNSGVREFGKRMETEHSTAGGKLREIAGHDNITLPSGMDKSDQFTYEGLSKLSGVQFDRAYARDMVSDHQADIGEFKRETINGKNADLKHFASDMLPMLEDHLRAAKQMEDDLQGGSNTQSAR